MQVRAITSTADNCLGSQCPTFDECHVVEARRRAAEADVVVANHHLLFADMALKEQGFAELLPCAGSMKLAVTAREFLRSDAPAGWMVAGRQGAGRNPTCRSNEDDTARPGIGGCGGNAFGTMRP